MSSSSAVASPPTSEAGYSTPAVVLAAGMAIIFFVALANLIAFQYAIGALRLALDEGVRAQSRAEATAGECQAVATSTLDGLLGGSMADGVTISCVDDGVTVTATAGGVLDSFSPWVPDRDVSDIRATAVKDRLP